MENKDISQTILDKIKTSGVKPISKTFFNFKKTLFWFLVGFSVIVGSLAFSIALSLLINNDWNLYGRFGFSFILKTMPYFWVACLILFVILGEYYYKKTFLGYRHRIITIVGFYMIITVIFGAVLYSIGIDGEFERGLYRKIPIYRVVTFDRERIWLQPNEGLLSGEIILINGDRIKIVDKIGTLWEIKTEDSFVARRVEMEEGECVKIMGKIENRQTFIAEEIKPCFSNMGRMGNFHKNQRMLLPN